MSQLALFGGKPIVENKFPCIKLKNKDKIKEELCKLIDTDFLSGYRGSTGRPFWGGKKVRELEEYFEKDLKQQSIDYKEEVYVLAVNSCTSALQIACGAIGLRQGDEVIVTPWSMSCSATAPMIYGAKPVFADIEKDYFCLDYKSIEEKITDNTQAIIVVDLFGLPYDVEKINEIAKKHNLFVIEDAAQAIGAKYNGIRTGLLGDIGCFSFTQGKHFTCGEGGFIVTKNEDLYMKCALIRNHAEAVISSYDDNNSFKEEANHYTNMIGFNMRMTELQAVVLLEQIKQIREEFWSREKNVSNLRKKIQIDGIEWSQVRENTRHSYYVFPFLYNESKIGINRKMFIKALQAELLPDDSISGGMDFDRFMPIWEGYVNPLYKMPLFKKDINYKDIYLPVVEDLQNNKLCCFMYQGLPLEDFHIELIAKAFHKVYLNRSELK